MTDRSWALSEVAAIVRGRLVGPDVRVTGVSTDSRISAPGSLFFALSGPSFDGHHFAASALGSGAAAAVVQPGRVDAEPRIEVPDPLEALRALAIDVRSKMAQPVIAVTGSTGKTSTKDLLSAAVPGAHASVRSFNNEIGVPLTVLGADPDASVLVLEVGSRGPGHIEHLAPVVRPDVAVITNLGLVHLETFGSIETLADSKFELVEALTAEGTAVLPVDEPLLDRPVAGSVMTFGATPEADVAVGDVQLDDRLRPTFAVTTPVGSVTVRLPLVGAHHALNTGAAIAAGISIGADIHEMAERLAKAEASPWRMEVTEGPITVVNDAYNANPTSMEAALRTVAASGRRPVAVLGRMAELGDVEAVEHRRIGSLAADLGFAAVIVVGEDHGIAEGAGVIAHRVSTAEEAITELTRLTRDGDVVLVKASRSVGLERLAMDLVEVLA